jgi:lipid-A-disaccharide synthase-like uncharacterized protein
MVLDLIREQVLPLSGMLLLVIAYFIVFRDPAKQSSLVYIWMNILGATILAVYAVFRREPMFFAIEAFWMVISVFLLIRRMRNRELISSFDPDQSKT